MVRTKLAKPAKPVARKAGAAVAAAVVVAGAAMVSANRVVTKPWVPKA